MDFSYRGANCVVITIKKETFIIDGAMHGTGLKNITKKDAIYLATQEEFVPEGVVGMVFDGPGDYEIRGVSVKGIGVPRMVDHDDVKKSTIFRIIAEGIAIAVIGHARVPLTEEELENIGVVDIAIIPVGGNGYTLDAHQAVSVVAQIEPKVVIPTHYADSSITYEVPQNGVDEFIKELGGEHEKMLQYRVKGNTVPMNPVLIELTKS